MSTTPRLHTRSRYALALSIALAGALGCRASSHPVQPATLGAGTPSASLAAIVDTPGTVSVETVVGAHWAVPLEGLLNLEHPEAVEAGLEDRLEPIEVFFHAVRHPEHGLFIIDTGVEQALRTAPDEAAIRGIVARAMDVENMDIRNDTAGWLAAQDDELRGVFLTHLHLDHVSGMPDVPKGTPIYAGPGESSVRSAENIAVAPVIDRALEGHDPVQQWQFAADPDGRFEGVLDVFGDGTFWALHVPGHTPGSTAYVARTPDGPVLFTGDASHTAWGWNHGVEPGEYSHDGPRSVQSLAALKAFADAHPSLDIRPGHQSL